MKKNPRARRDAVKRAIVQTLPRPNVGRPVEVLDDDFAHLSDKQRVELAAYLINTPADQLRAWLAQRGAF